VKRGVSKLDRFLDYLTARWQAGCHNASQLWREIAQQGFTGARGLVAKWAVAQRQVLPAQTLQHPSSSPLATPAKKVTPWPAGRTAWLLVKPETLLDEAEQQALLRIKQADATVAQAHQLVHAFQRMMREQKPDHLLAWLQEVVESGIDALISFANGIRQDFEAVKNALALPWSNGQTEGQVNRLKLIKRQMYGRANFDLLRRRVLAVPLRL
jgi:transposase